MRYDDDAPARLAFVTKTADHHVCALIENTSSNSPTHRSIAIGKVNVAWIQAGVTESGCTGGFTTPRCMRPPGRRLRTTLSSDSS